MVNGWAFSYHVMGAKSRSCVGCRTEDSRGFHRTDAIDIVVLDINDGEATSGMSGAPFRRTGWIEVICDATARRVKAGMVAPVFYNRGF